MISILAAVRAFDHVLLFVNYIDIVGLQGLCYGLDVRYCGPSNCIIVVSFSSFFFFR